MFAAAIAVTMALVLAAPVFSMSGPEVWTDKSGYLAGEAIHIAGEGFLPSEQVALRVIHDDGTAEIGGGHEPFFVKADDEGAIEADWSIAPDEAAGVHFVLLVEGRSGLTATATLDRVGRISAKAAENRIRVLAQGFNPNESVSLKLDNGEDYPVVLTQSDDSGNVRADLELPPDNPDAIEMTVTAKGKRSGLSLTVSLSDYVVVNRKPSGVPQLEELRASAGLAQIGFRQGDLYTDLFIRSNSPGSTACALFDTDGEPSGQIDFAVCGRIPGGPHGMVTTSLVYTCDNERRDRCGTPTPFGTPAQVRASVQSTLDSASPLMLRFRLDRSFLPADIELVSVCSYASAGADVDDGPLDCIALMSTNKEDSVAAAAPAGPSLTGRVVYHSYVSYGDGTSQLYLLDLATSKLTNLSNGWTNLADAMNAHWSPDGSKIVFMARPKKGRKASAWFDVFLYTVGQSGNPVNLTNTSTKHDEDPKFSPDGSKIVYKVRPSSLVEMNLKGNILATITSVSGQERSMPYYTSNAAAVWFSNQPLGTGGYAASIHRINTDESGEVVEVDTPDVIDFYPIRDTIGQFLYSRTVSATNLYGQVYMFDGSGGVSLPFNTADADYNDAFPMGAQYIVLSSTRQGGRGGYDLYVADRNTGTIWSMNGYNSGVNSSREELGAAYTSN